MLSEFILSWFIISRMSNTATTTEPDTVSVEELTQLFFEDSKVDTRFTGKHTLKPCIVVLCENKFTLVFRRRFLSSQPHGINLKRGDHVFPTESLR